MNLSTEEREQVATELKRFASDLNLTDDQKEKLRVVLTEARERIAEYMQQNPNTAKADIVSKVVANRDAIRQRVVTFLSPEQLKKWDDEKAKAKDFLGQKIAA
jgi:anti-sigma regulatory factor (Ser/Thr protein kinase)